MTSDALIGIVGILIGCFGIFRTLSAYNQTIKSAEPDPERVRRFVELAPPLPAHLLRESEMRVCAAAPTSCASREGCPSKQFEDQDKA